jgi:hypothetical protein
MKAFLIVIMSVCDLLYSSNMFGQVRVPWNKSNVVARLRSTVVSLDTAYRYTYVIQNDSTSPERLEVVRIEAGDIEATDGGTIGNFIDPSTKNWSGWTDAVGAQPPDPSAKGIILWDVDDSTTSIDDLDIPAPSSLAPGESITGSFDSKGLPAIKRFWVKGFIRPITEQIFDSLLAAGHSEDSILFPWYLAGVQGRTVSPLLPSIPFNALNFLDTIISYINQSRTLGWITNDPTANKYRRLIDTARFHLQANNRGITKARLDSVLLSANADSASTLTSEAYALLRFNTEYVIKKLREEDDEEK